jgi:DNA-binding transcriptional LysR family regulator
MRGTDFVALNAFAAVIEHRSFVRASAHLGITPSALSQTIRQLEERLGVRLLHRTTRSVAPTSVGERLYERFRPSVDELEAAVAEAVSTRDRPAGIVRINAPRMAATGMIAPRLGRFHRNNPDVVLDITVDNALTDIVAGRFDAGIRLGELLEKDMVAIRLTGEMEMMAVASPDYLARHGTPATPGDLHRHACVNWRWPSDGSLYRWEFEEEGREIEVSVNGPLVSNDIEVVLEAALQGLGIAYTSHERIESWCREGKLVRILEAFSPRFPGAYLYYPSRRQQSPALRAFIECLLDRDLQRAP